MRFLKSSLVDFHTNRWRWSICFILDQMTDDFIFNTSLLSALFSSICNIQTFESSDDVHKDTESHNAVDEGKKKENKVDEHKEEKWENEEIRCLDEFVTVTDVTDLRDFFKCTANNADLNEKENSTHRSEKFRCADECVDLYCRERVWCF